eukprot:scaffold110018_cov69-Phaeocystis_antarctica.AAC.1
MRSVFLTCGFGKSAGVRSAMRCIVGDGDAFGLLRLGVPGGASQPPLAQTKRFKSQTFGQLRNSARAMARPLRGLK